MNEITVLIGIGFVNKSFEGMLFCIDSIEGRSESGLWIYSFVWVPWLPPSVFSFPRPYWLPVIEEF